MLADERPERLLLSLAYRGSLAPIHRRGRPEGTVLVRCLDMPRFASQDTRHEETTQNDVDGEGAGVSHGDLEVIAELVAEKVIRRLGSGILHSRSEREPCGDETKGESASTHNQNAERGGWKSPAQTARELLKRLQQKNSPKW